MVSHARSGTREEQSRLSVRTLGIASTASLIAAVVTSRFWIAGTPMAAAVTPVIVAIVSELLHKPTEVIAQRFTTSDRTAIVHDPASAVPPPPAEPERGRGAAQAEPARGGRFAQSSPSRPPPGAERGRLRHATSATVARAGGPPGGAMRVYRPARRRRRRFAVRAVAATAVLAFAIATAALTLPELIAGQSLTHSGRHTTLFGGQAKKTSSTPSPVTPTQPQQGTTPSSKTPPQTTPQAPSGGSKQQTTPKPTQQQGQQQQQQQSPSGGSGGGSGGAGTP